MAHRCPLLWIVVAAPLLSHIQLFVTPWTAAHQAPRFSTISQSLLKFMPIELVVLSNHLILCHCLLLPSIFPSVRVFSSEWALHIRWPKSWSFSISPSNEYSGLISFRIGQYPVFSHPESSQSVPLKVAAAAHIISNLSSYLQIHYSSFGDFICSFHQTL